MPPIGDPAKPSETSVSARSPRSSSFRSLSHWGAFTAHVEDGRLVSVSPFEHDPHPNSLIDAWPEMVYAKNRVTEPMVRAGWLRSPRGAPSGVRGDDSFVAVSWDEALGLVADEVARVRERYGNPAIFGGSYGWASAGRLHHARTLLHRFLWAIGGATMSTTNYSFGAAMLLLPHVLGNIDTVAGNVTEWREIFAHTERFIAFGGLPSKNWKVASGGAGLHEFDDHAANARASNIAFTSISPLRDDGVAAFGATWQPIRPGSDTALILALAYVVHERGAVDHAFLERCCTGSDRFLAYVDGRSDGAPKSPAWAAPLTGLSAETIVALAESLIGKRTLLTASWALQRAENGEQPFWALIALAALLGQLGLPGAGVGFGYGSINSTGAEAFRTPAFGMPARSHSTDLSIPVARVADMLLDPGGTFEFDGATLTYPDIHMVYWAGGNPFHHHQDLFRLRDAFAKPDTIVVHEPWWTATARQADIVLPATTPLERNDIGGSSRDPFLFAMQRAIEPFAQARNDFDIFGALAERLGVRNAYDEGLDENAWLRRIYETAQKRLGERHIDAPPFETFWNEGFLRVPAPENAVTPLAAFRADPVARRLATPSGKVELFSQTVADFGYANMPGHPFWSEPREWLGAPLAERFPLHMVSTQPADKLHAQMDGSSESRRGKVAGRNELWMHPDDARKRGLTEGSVVRVFNDRGGTLAGLRTTSDIIPGVVRLPTGTWFDPAPDGERLDKHGNPNAITQDVGTSQLGQGCAAQSCLVEVTAFIGTPPAVTAFDLPRGGRVTAKSPSG
jgi:biotin/methionine sulfoxide reductase